MSICDTCRVDKCFHRSPYTTGCSRYKAKQKTMTNADRIRAMSDEELASYWAEHYDEFCPNKPECGAILDTENSIPDGWCAACVLEWLRKPVED